MSTFIKASVGFLSLVILGTALTVSAASHVGLKEGVSGASSLSTHRESFSWTEKTPGASWPARMGHTSVDAKNKMWVMGGFTFPNILNNDIWDSEDGAHWDQVTAHATWSPRATQASTVFKDKIWVMGGFGETHETLNDVWYTPTKGGVNWTQALAVAPWESRQGFGLTVFNDGSGEKMWIAGGMQQLLSGPVIVFNDVWNSSDGVNWTQATPNAPWAGRRYSGFVSFNHKIWILAGSDQTNAVFNDVWNSSDGVNWTQVTAHAPWAARAGEQVVVADGKMWVIGGTPISGNTHFNDVWSSSDGINWTESLPTAPWDAREFHTSLFAKNRLWVIGGGQNQPIYNDVWASQVLNAPAL